MAQPTQYYVDPAGGSDTTGDGSIGTPWASIQHALDNITQDLNNGDQINIKVGTEDVLTAPTDFSTYGTSFYFRPICLSGYTSTANDYGRGVINCDGQPFTTSISQDAVILKDLEIYNFGNNQAIHLDQYAWLDNCLIHGCTYTGTSPIVDINSTLTKITNCQIYDMPNAQNSRILSLGSYGYCENNFVEQSGSDYGILGNTGAVIRSNIIKADYATASASYGLIEVGSFTGATVKNNSIYSSVARTGLGIRLSSSSGNTLVENNIIEGLSGSGAVGISSTFSPESSIIRNNRAFNCTTAFDLTHYLIEENNTTLSASPFTNPATNDFTVNTDLKGAGFPNYIGGRHFTSTPTYVDIGASQRQETSGGGGGSSKSFYIISM